MLQTFISRISGAAEQGTRQRRRRIFLRPRAGAAARGGWPRGQAARVGGVAGEPPWASSAPALAPRGPRPGRLCGRSRTSLRSQLRSSLCLPLVYNLSPKVTGPRRPVFFPEAGKDAGALSDNCCSLPALAARLSVPPGAPGYPLLSMPPGTPALWTPAPHWADASLWSRAKLLG